MSDTLYGITHLFFHSNSTQKSIYCSTNNFKHLVQSTHLFLSLPPVKPCRNPNFFYSTNDYKALHSQHTPSSVSSPGEALQKSNFFIVPTITNLSDSILAVLGDSIQSELWTLKNLFFRVHLNLERA